MRRHAVTLVTSLTLAVGFTGCADGATGTAAPDAGDPNVYSAVTVTDEQVTAAIAKLDDMARQVMADTGIPHEAGDDLEELGYDRMQIIERFPYLPRSPFRDQSRYTNFGLTAAAEAVARSQGVPWEELAAQRIYEPLGMTRTTSVFEEFMAQDNRATLHVPAGDA